MIRNTFDNFSIVRNYLNSSQNVIINIVPIENYNDYPKFYQFTAEHMDFSDDKKADLLSNGIDENPTNAIIKTVMETLERWYLVEANLKDTIFSSFNRLQKQKIEAVSPAELSPFSKTQLQLRKFEQFRFDNKTKSKWIPVHDLLSKTKVYIPLSLVVYPQIPETSREKLILVPNSTGTAAGYSLQEALYRSICELIERDAYMIMFYNKLPFRRIDNNSIADKTLRQLIDYLEKYLLKVNLFYITLDINIPVIFCCLIDETGKGPRLMVGAKCDLDINTATYGAILEAVQGLTSYRDMYMIIKKLSKKNFNKLHKSINLNKPILDRAVFWIKNRALTELDFLLKTETVPYPKHVRVSSQNKLDSVVKILKDAGIKKIYWKKISPDSLDPYNIFCVRVIMPGLVPLSISKDYPHFGHQRIFAIPPKLGFFIKSKKIKELNTVPHPVP